MSFSLGVSSAAWCRNSCTRQAKEAYTTRLETTADDKVTDVSALQSTRQAEASVLDLRHADPQTGRASKHAPSVTFPLPAQTDPTLSQALCSAGGHACLCATNWVFKTVMLLKWTRVTSM
eukprot:3186901-Rhodomonas_salina.1